MKKETSIVFTGDIGFDRYMDKQWLDEELLSQPILDFFYSAEHVAANIEGALIHAVDDGHKGQFFHCMDPDVTRLLRKIQADIWCIANNHAMDAGPEGLHSTKTLASKMGAVTIGAGMDAAEASKPVYLEEAGGIGIFCVAYQTECVPATATQPGTFRWDDMDAIQMRIAEIKKACRWCVIVSHGGEEFAALPNPYTRDRYLKYLELGADVVVAHHPHVPENYELFDDGKMIFYSLGNFIFDTDYQRAHPYTDTGVLLKLIFSEKKVAFDAIGTKILRGEERIDIAPLPDVFTNIPALEYELLAPLSAKAFIIEDRRTMTYVRPERFSGATEAFWQNYYAMCKPSGYAEGQIMDFRVIVPLAEKADSGKWKESRLEKVKQYLLNQL